ncbi:unnamed protein product [Effrenium voratum]|nr:unnamed protein product [Effrenium voratum]
MQRFCWLPWTDIRWTQGQQATARTRRGRAQAGVAPCGLAGLPTNLLRGPHVSKRALRAAGPSCMLAGAQSMPRQVQQAEGKKAAERQPRSQHPETQTMPRGVEQNDQPPDDTRRQLSQFQAALARLDDLACTKQERAMPEL